MRWVDERQTPRVPLMVPVYFEAKFFERVGEEVADLTGKVLAWTQDVSLGGLSLCTKIPLFLRETLDLQFELPDSLDPVRTLARVVWHAKKEYQKQTYHLVGLQFESLEDREELKLVRYVQSKLTA